MFKKIILAVMMMTLVAGASYAAQGDGTSGGTVIGATAASLSATYTGGTLDVSQIGASEDNTVDNIFGLVFISIDSPVTGVEGDPLQSLMVVKNNGNATDGQLAWATPSYTLNNNTNDQTTEADWVAVLAVSDDFDGGNSLAEEANGTIQIDISSVPVGTLNGSSFNVTVTMNTTSEPYGAYTGHDSQSYGGLQDISQVAIFEISGAADLQVISSGRSSAVDASGMTGYTIGQLGRAADDVVPGAKITYTTVIQNVGDIAANDIDFTDYVPVNTTYYGAAPLSYEADDGVDFAVLHDGGTLTWLQNNAGSNSLAVNGFITLNFTVTID